MSTSERAERQLYALWKTQKGDWVRTPGGLVRASSESGLCAYTDEEKIRLIEAPPEADPATPAQAEPEPKIEVPDRCPITGMPFFMFVTHPELGYVPTYGGPYDSYTIPEVEDAPEKPLHERDLVRRRYDHDLGG